MGGDIEEAIQGAVDLFNTFTAEDKSIGDYVHMPFNDPATGPVYRTTDRHLFLAKLVQGFAQQLSFDRTLRGTHR